MNFKKQQIKALIIINVIFAFVFAFVIGCGQNKLEKTTDALINALRDEDSSVRGEAAYSLGVIKSVKTTEQLIQALKDENSYVRCGAANALGQMRSEKAVIS